MFSAKARIVAVALAAGTILAVSGTAHADTRSPAPTDTSSSSPQPICVCGPDSVVIRKVVAPKINGTARVGKKLTAKMVVTVEPATTKTTLHYQWLASGRKIKGATKSTFIVPASVRGKKVSVVVTLKILRADGSAMVVSKSSKATAAVKL